MVAPLATNLKSDKTRHEILRAAAKLFRDQGYSATTLRQIAAVSNLKAGSIYYHFSSKEEMLDEVLTIGLEGIFVKVKEAVLEVGSMANAEAQLIAAIDAHLRTLSSLSEFAAVHIRIYGQLPEHIRVRHNPERQKYGSYWDDLFRKAINEGVIRDDVKVEPLREFVLGALNWTAEWFDPKRHSVDDLVERCTKLVLFGLVNHEKIEESHVVNGGNRLDAPS